MAEARWYRVKVLWHPTGAVDIAEAVRNGNRYYALDGRKRWWLLSRKAKDGWRAPVLQIKNRDPSQAETVVAKKGARR